MKKNEQRIVILLIAILVVSMVNIGYELYHIINYQNRIIDGNERWHQVEEKMVEMEHRIDEIEREA